MNQHCDIRIIAFEPRILLVSSVCACVVANITPHDEKRCCWGWFLPSNSHTRTLAHNPSLGTAAVALWVLVAQWRFCASSGCCHTQPHCPSALRYVSVCLSTTAQPSRVAMCCVCAACLLLAWCLSALYIILACLVVLLASHRGAFTAGCCLQFARSCEYVPCRTLMGFVV